MDIAEIRDFYCSDIDDIQTWTPSDPVDVDFWITVILGSDQHGGDSFEVHVVSPKNLGHGTEAKRYSLVMAYYDWELLMEEINKVIQKCRGITWNDIAKQLSMHFKWEYEGMVPPYQK